MACCVGARAPSFGRGSFASGPIHDSSYCNRIFHCCWEWRSAAQTIYVGGGCPAYLYPNSDMAFAFLHVAHNGSDLDSSPISQMLSQFN